MNIKAVLIDDEVNNIDNLTQLLKAYCPGVTVSATAMDADEGRDIILKYQPDLVFLDIQMPGKNGFDMLRSLSRYDFEVIFVTAYDRYGIQAVKFAALDYIMKPIDVKDLRSAVKKAMIKIHDKVKNLQLENLIHLLKEQRDKQDHRIVLKTIKETRFIPTQQIIHCESSNNYTSFYLANGEKLIVSRPIYEYEELLEDYGFIRCHQSHLVNKKYVRSWMEKEGGSLMLENGDQIPVSRAKKDTVRKALEDGYLRK